jgi:methionyl-tRNA formyltransferase
MRAFIMEDLRIIFMGTPEFALPALRSLVQAHHKVVAVYTQPPRPAGRGQRETPSPVHQYAGQHGLRVETPRTLKDPAVRQQIRDLQPDAIVVSAYGLLLPEEVLKLPRFSCLNVHPSLLPRWRGAAPIQRAIMAGDGETGVTIMQMDVGLDTGAILLTQPFAIPPEMNARDLHDRLSEMSGVLVLQTLEGLAGGTLQPQPQPAEGVTYAAKITKEEEQIDWSRPATDIHNQIRGLAPQPGAHFTYRGEDIKILAAQLDPNLSSCMEGSVIDREFTISCGTGSIRPTLLQRPGKKPVAVRDFLNGFSIQLGTILE